MTLIQFFLTLFIFISLLAGSGVLVASICLMLRFPPLLLVVGLGCALLSIALKKLRHEQNSVTA